MRYALRSSLMSIAAGLLLMSCERWTATYGSPPPARTQTVAVASQTGGPPAWAPAHGYRNKQRYRYYYAERVYYNVDRGQWVWQSIGRAFSASRPGTPPDWLACLYGRLIASADGWPNYP